MKKIIFISGPVRSGKSQFAIDLAKGFKKPVIFIATSKSSDSEMKKRIKSHQLQRPKNWQTIEETINLVTTLNSIKYNKVVLIDCLTLWISNLFLSGLKEKDILQKVEDLICVIRKVKVSLIIVSNEVGWGIVPENKISRDFRDVIGRLHQKLAQVCNEVYLLVSGIPLNIKQGSNMLKAPACLPQAGLPDGRQGYQVIRGSGFGD